MTEEMEGILRRADGFDRLTAESGWKEVLEFMASRVNDAIVLASQTEESRDVIRWNAKRSLLDDVIALVEDTRKQRDEIRNIQKEMENYAGSIR